jgi:hypothetical protein
MMVRKLKITPEMKKMLRYQRKKFIEKFGRKPGPDDPVFFDPEASTPVSLTPKQLEDATLRAMLAAGTPPQFVYAYQKSGFLVNESGYENMSPEDRAAYDAAIDEYFAMEMPRRRRPSSSRQSSRRRQRGKSMLRSYRSRTRPSLPGPRIKSEGRL